MLPAEKDERVVVAVALAVADGEAEDAVEPAAVGVAVGESLLVEDAVELAGADLEAAGESAVNVEVAVALAVNDWPRVAVANDVADAVSVGTVHMRSVMAWKQNSVLEFGSVERQELQVEQTRVEPALEA